MSYSEAQTRFFKSPEFAVVGASTVEEKYGTKVLKWYINHGKTVTPIHPKETELQGIETLRSLKDLPSPHATSVSIITPAKITLGLLQEVSALNIPAVWIQPGADDEAVREYIETEGLQDRVILGGPCVLVDGEGIIKSLL